MPNSLRLWIVSCSCKCSHKWTHCYTTFFNGGTPTAREESLLPLAAINEGQRHFSHCFRCAPITLPKGWAKTSPTPTPTLGLAKLFED